MGSSPIGSIIQRVPKKWDFLFILSHFSVIQSIKKLMPEIKKLMAQIDKRWHERWHKTGQWENDPLAENKKKPQISLRP